jgi:hypothetical protein
VPLTLTTTKNLIGALAMATVSLNHPPHLITQQIKSLESLYENLIKAKTMVDLVLEKELLDYPATLMYYYFAAISDFLLQASVVNESILANLIKNNAPQVAERMQ